MRPVRLAVLFDQEIEVGGGYQQALSAALLAKKLPSRLAEPVFFTTMPDSIKALKSHGIDSVYLRLSVPNRVLLVLRRLVRDPLALKILKKLADVNAFERYLVDYAIDIVYFLSPSSLVKDLERLNYIVTVWDLCHRDNPEFPEVRADRIFDKRESYYRDVLPKATAVLVDSAIGKKNMIRRYGVEKERVHVMPFAPAPGVRFAKAGCEKSFVDIRRKYNLDTDYVFYPAQFWAHKNHIYLLEGLKCLEERFGYRIGAIFAGSDKGNLAYVQRKAEEMGLLSRIRFGGFVPNDEMPYLYSQALALVMPTYFGPTNLPPLEAFGMGVPVLYPDKAGLREQVGDAGLLMNLQDPISMAGLLAALLKDAKLRAQCVARGEKLMAGFSYTYRLGVLRDILQEFQCKRHCWP